MSNTIYKEKATTAVAKIKQIYEKSPFGKLIIEECNRPHLVKFIEERVKESDNWKMNISVGDYFKNFNLYPEKAKSVLVIENHIDLVKLKELGFFKDPNATIVIILNNTFSTHKENGKIKSHYDYWRLFTTEALDYIQLNHKNIQTFLFLGSDLCHDFSELIIQEHNKILLPEVESLCYSDKSLFELEFGEFLK